MGQSSSDINALFAMLGNQGPVRQEPVGSQGSATPVLVLHPFSPRHKVQLLRFGTTTACGLALRATEEGAVDWERVTCQACHALRDDSKRPDLVQAGSRSEED